MEEERERTLTGATPHQNKSNPQKRKSADRRSFFSYPFERFLDGRRGQAPRRSPRASAPEGPSKRKSRQRRDLGPGPARRRRPKPTQTRWPAGTNAVPSRAPTSGPKGPGSAGQPRTGMSNPSTWQEITASPRSRRCGGRADGAGFHGLQEERTPPPSSEERLGGPSTTGRLLREKGKKGLARTQERRRRRGRPCGLVSSYINQAGTRVGFV